MGAWNGFFRRESQKGRAGFGDEPTKPMPVAAGDGTKLFCRGEMKIEDDERQISVSHEPIGGFHCVFNLATAHPEKPATGFRAERLGIEAIASIDVGEVLLFAVESPQKAGQNEPWSAAAPVEGTNHFVDFTPANTDLVEGADASREAIACLVRWLIAVSFGKLIAQFRTELKNGGGVSSFQRMNNVYANSFSSSIKIETCAPGGF